MDESGQREISAVLREAARCLESRSESSRLDAELLLAHVLGGERIDLISRGSERVSEADFAHLSELVARRKDREPIAYITGRQEFWSLNFMVSPAVLIPRPDTERLVELSLECARRHALESGGAPIRVLDLGTGSGCIAIALAHELRKMAQPYWIVASDKSLAALAVAQQNARAHGLCGGHRPERVDGRASASKDLVAHGAGFSLVAMNWCEGLFGDDSGEGAFDLIISNPPYVRRDATDVSPEIRYEPESALFAENSGLAEMLTIIEQVPPLLSTRGQFLCECGSDQGPALRGRFQSAPFARFKSCEILQDYAQRDRVMRLSEPLGRTARERAS